MTIEQFGKALAASGLMTADDVRAFWTALPAESRPKSADDFGARLVEKKLLTAYQIQRILAGQGGSLVMGDYVILAEIGAGGMGQVYKAKHRRMERIVALKVMSSAAMKDEAAVKRFQREVRAAAKLEHPNIVTAYDSGEAGNVKYLVMQFVDGGDLSSLVKGNGPLPVEKAVDYVLQAARGLSFAHGEGVIHRDIKPANLLVDKKGVVKILDMGLARIESGDDGLTATEQVMGTVDYMSPEQAANTKGADGRADIYSLGCTLWYLLTGKKAYEGDTMIARLMAHRDAPLPSLVKARDDAPWALEQALHKMLAKRAQDRFQSMDEVVAALEPFGGGGSSSKGPMGSSIGGGSQQSAELAAFLQSVGPKPGASGTNLGATKTATEPKSSPTLGPEVTASFVKADAETDPKSQLLPRAKPLPAPQPRPVKKKKPPVALIAGGVGVLVIALVAGIIVTIKNKDGEVVATVEAPTGATVEVRPTPAASKTPAAVPVRPAAEVIRLLESTDYAWAPPENLGPGVNSTQSETFPTLSADELCVILQMPGQEAMSRLVESRRASRDEPFGKWTRLTGSAHEEHPSLSADGLTLFYATQAGSVGGLDIRMRRRASRDAPWGPIEKLNNYVNGTSDDCQPWLSYDGLALYFSSSRPGSVGERDIWLCRRKSVNDEFGPAINAGRAINSPQSEYNIQTTADDTTPLFTRNGKPFYGYTSPTGVQTAIDLPDYPPGASEAWLSPDGERLYYGADVPGGLGNADIWMSRRVPKSSLPAATPAVIAALSSASTPILVAEAGWTSLFNGLDLLGWKAVGEKGWSVENGAIVGRASSPAGWLKSDATYRDFELEFEYRLTPDSNSGVFLRAPAEGNVSGKDFHEIQLLDDTSAKFAIIPAMSKTGSLYNKLAAQKSKVPGPNVWHKMSVSAIGERVRVRLNDEQILEGQLPPGKQSEGHVGFQLYPHEVALRNIRIRPLKPDGTPIAPAAQATAAAPLRNALRLTRGAYVDLAGDLIYDGGDVTFETWLISDKPRWTNTFLAVDHDFAGRRHALRLSVVGDQNLIEVSRPSDQLIFRFDDMLPAGRPAHLAAVWQGRDLRLYIDGKRLTPRPHQFPFAARPGPPYAWLGGMPADAALARAQHSCEATLLETRITSRARYDADFTPAAQLTADADTVLLYKFDEGSGEVLHDSSGHGRQAKIVGAKWTKVAGVPSSAPQSVAGGSYDYAIDFTGINGLYVREQSFDTNRPFTMECTATPLKLPTEGDQWNSPILNVSWSQLKLFSRPSQNRHSYSCILHHDDGSLTTLDLGAAVVGKPTRIAVCADGREALCFVNGKLVRRERLKSPLKNTEGCGVARYSTAQDVWTSFPGLIDEARFSTVARYTADYVPQSRFDADADTALLLHFDEGSGETVRDSSRHGHVATVAGAKWRRADGTPIDAARKGPTALKFAGNAESLVEVPNIPWGRLDTFTVEAWVRSDETAPGTGFVFDRYKSASLNRYEGRWQFTVKKKGEEVPVYATQSSGQGSKPGRWEHLAGVVQNKTMTLYVDGKRVRTTPLPDELEDGLGDRLMFGRNLLGAIRAARYSKSARYTADFAPQEQFESDAETLALYRFDEGSGDVLRDSSGHNLHGTIKGAEWVTIDGAAPAAANRQAQAPTEALFAAGDLAGWTGDPSIWKIDNGELIGRLRDSGEVYLAGRKNYRDVEVTFDVRLFGNVNSGLQFRSKLAKETPTEIGGPQAEIGAGGKTGYAGFWWQGVGGQSGRVVQPVATAVFEPLLKANDYNRMTVRCVGKHVTITLNGTTTVDGDFADVPDEGVLGWQLVSKGGPAEVRFRNVQVRDLSAPATASTLSPGQDLLAAVQIPRDVRSGDWRIENGVLVTAVEESGKPQSVLYLSPEQKVPEQYDLELVVEREQAGGTGMCVGIVAGGAHQATVMMDSYGVPNRWGLENIDGKYLSNGNPTNTPGSRLPPGKKKTMRIEVRRTGVRTLLDGEQVFAWQGRPDQLSTAFWKVEKPQSLFLGSQGRFRIHKIALTPR